MESSLHLLSECDTHCPHHSQDSYIWGVRGSTNSVYEKQFKGCFLNQLYNHSSLPFSTNFTHFPPNPFWGSYIRKNIKKKKLGEKRWLAYFIDHFSHSLQVGTWKTKKWELRNAHHRSTRPRSWCSLREDKIEEQTLWMISWPKSTQAWQMVSSPQPHQITGHSSEICFEPMLFKDLKTITHELNPDLLLLILLGPEPEGITGLLRHDETC